MSFVYPSFLFALFAVSIPVIIHLFNFRRFKKVYFPDIRFLKEVKQQMQNRNRIKHLLVLLMRILAISFLVFAFAQPFIPAGTKNTVGGIQAVSVYVDNSFSMENVSRNGVLLDEAKKMAREIALSHSQTDQFQLLTNDFEGKHQRLVNREEFLTMLDEIKASPSVRNVSEINARQNDVLSKSGSRSKKSFILSDFQRSISDFDKVKEDTAVRSVLLPVPANQQSNLYIDSCWFESPVHQLNQPENLTARIRNYSENNLENIPIKLFLNKQQKTPASFSIGPGESKEITLSFVIKEPGIQHGRIEITDYPVTYDDKFFFSFKVEKNIPVTCIASSDDIRDQGAQRSIQSLFGGDSLFLLNMAAEKKMDYSTLSAQQVIVLSELKAISSGLAQELTRFVQNGGSLVIFPSPETDTLSYRAFLAPLGTNFYLRMDTAATKVDWVNFESEIFSDVFEKPALSGAEGKGENLDLPLVHRHYSLSRSSRTNEEVLLRMKNGSPFFSKYTCKKGKVYLGAVPLQPEWSNLDKHAIFVPLMYKIAVNSQPSSSLFYTVGRDNSIDVHPAATTGPAKPNLTGESVLRIKGENNFEIIPEHRMVDLQPTVFIHGQVKEAGNYGLFAESGEVTGIALNYDRKESDLSRYSTEELISLYENANLSGFSLIDAGEQDLTKVLADISQGKKLWKWCILLVLLFLAAETLLLRFWK